METRKAFSERVAALRSEKGLTQGALAEALGISRQSVTQYENGIRVPDIEVFRKFTGYFGVTADYLLGISDHRTTETAGIGDKLGLSDEAIILLSNIQEYKKIYNDTTRKNDEIPIDLIRKIIIFDDTDSLLEELLNENKNDLASLLEMEFTKMQAVLDILIGNYTVLMALNEYLTSPDADSETCEDLYDRLEAEKQEAFAMYRLQKELIELRKTTEKIPLKRDIITNLDSLK